MALRESPFSNCFVEALHAISWALILPCFCFLNRVIALCTSTTLERIQRSEQECYLHPLRVVFGFILFFTLFLVSCPLALLGFLLWAPLQAVRRPFSYHQQATLSSVEDRSLGFAPEGKATFGFASANLCLLPDGLARFNNLADTQLRAAAIGQRIAQGVSRPNIRIFVDSPSSCGTLSPSASLLPNAGSSTPAGGASTYGATTNSQPQSPVTGHPDGDLADVEVPATDPAPSPPAPVVNTNQNSNQQEKKGHRNPPRVLLCQGLGQGDELPWEVSAMFPTNVDMLCLQEVFDKRAGLKLIEALCPLYGHILYDVGVYAFQPPCGCSSFKFFNSGLFMASRYPVLDAQYHCFPNGQGEDGLAAKGLLSAKVLVGQNQKEKKAVGYFNCTHLHAPEGEGEVRCEQLDMVTKWIDDFQALNNKPDEVVVFDVLCGDFNFDNCSPDDSREQQHSVFQDYRDPCRAGPGSEKPWVIGTLLEQPTLYDENVATPENLQRTLEREELRKQFISPPVARAGTPMTYPESGQPWVGRRLDYILYRESSIAKHCRTGIEEVTFVTQLAGLTDHIPVGLKLNVVLDDAEDD